MRGLSPAAAEALLILDAPRVLGDLGLAGPLASARQLISVTSGLAGQGSGLVHLDMPRWFADAETVPELRTLAQAVRQQRRLAFRYQRGADAPVTPRTAAPLGLVNKAGLWYLIAATGAKRVRVFRAARISRARLLADSVAPPAGFDLAEFWAGWSAAFMTGRPRLAVCVRVAPDALAGFAEVLGEQVLAAASPPGPDGWRTVTLSFEHELAAAHRLAGFGGLVEVLSPVTVRDRLVAIAEQLLDRYRGRPA